MAHPVRADGDADRAWWAAPPTRRVSHLPGVDPELLRVAFDPLPPAAPAVVHYRPTGVGPLGALVDALLDQLDTAALAMFPRWLAGADRFDGEGTLGVAAVRALAARTAAASRHFGPFLADLAERGLRGPRHRAGRSRFAPGVRAVGLARVIAEAYDRESCVLVVALPDLAADAERTLVAAAEWFVRHGGFTVWLVGGPLRHADRVRSVPIALPPRFAGLAGAVDGVAGAVDGLAGAVGGLAGAVDGLAGAVDGVPTTAERQSTVLAWPPIAGVPRGDSAAEQALERALRPHDWARGRRWNQTYEWHLLGEAYRLDLFWPAEGLAVEVDGPEHRGRIAFANDRRRDVQLQLLGLDVLRFTNEQVLTDAPAVVDGIRRLLARRRTGGTHPHGDETS